MDKSVQERRGRRWLRFGLGTMFLLTTLVAIWLTRLADEMQLVRQRQAWLRENAELANLAFKPKRTASIPYWREWLGDSAVATISYPPYLPRAEAEGDRMRARRLFPEAEFIPNLDAELKNYEYLNLQRAAEEK